MSILGLPFFLLVWLLSGSGGQKDLSTHATSTPKPPKPPPKPVAIPVPTAVPVPVPVPTVPSAAPVAPPPVVPVSTSAIPAPEPWPQVVPSGLPSFPSGWVPDQPPGAGVASRAAQLLPELWRHGEGTRKTEQTAGRWITYRATAMGNKRGVVAYRLADETPFAPAVPTAAPAAQPKVVPASTATPAKTGLRTLRLTSPRTTGSDVKVLQQKLGLTADGVYGTGSVAAVKAYQSRHGLSPDGVVGPKTWASLYGSQV